VCGRFTNTRSKSDEIQQKLVAKLDVQQPRSDRSYARFNIAPTQEVLAVVEDHDERRMQLLRWGLIPRWAKDVKVGYKGPAPVVSVSQGPGPGSDVTGASPLQGRRCVDSPHNDLPDCVQWANICSPNDIAGPPYATLRRSLANRNAPTLSRR
jgi:hypothetical protein